MKRLAKSSLALITLTALIIAGCAKPEDKLVGHYNGKANIPEATKKELARTHPEQLPLLDALEAGTYSLDLKQDKTYSSLMSVMGHDNPTAGTWTLDGNQITLHNSALPNSTNPTTLTVSDDGKTLTNLNKVDRESTITFTRS